jgi:hypothetical protein
MFAEQQVDGVLRLLSLSQSHWPTRLALLTVMTANRLAECENRESKWSLQAPEITLFNFLKR